MALFRRLACFAPHVTENSSPNKTGSCLCSIKETLILSSIRFFYTQPSHQEYTYCAVYPYLLPQRPMYIQQATHISGSTILKPLR